MMMDVLASFYNGEKGAESRDLDYLRRDPSAAGNLISGYSQGSLDNISSRV